MAISLISFVLLGVVVYLAAQALTKKKKSLPGPKVRLLLWTVTRRNRSRDPQGWPIIGNLLDMPAAGDENIAWMKLREIYGTLTISPST